MYPIFNYDSGFRIVIPKEIIEKIIFQLNPVKALLDFGNFISILTQ